MADDTLSVVFVKNNPAQSSGWDDLLNSLAEHGVSVRQVSGTDIMLDKVVPRHDQTVLLHNVGELGPFTHLCTQTPQPSLIILADEDNLQLARRALQAGAQDFIAMDQATPLHLLRAIQFAAERKQRAVPIEESEVRYRELVKNARDVVLITDATGNIIDANQAALDLFAYSREEMTTAHSRSLFADETVYPVLVNKLEQYKPLKDYEVQLRRKDGQILDCLLNLSSRRLTDGAVAEYHAIIRNITRRKSLEEVWRHYEFIVNNSKEFMTLLNRDYIYEAVNESYCYAHGKPRENIVGKTVANVWGEGTYLNKIKETLDQCFAGDEVYFQGWLGFAALGERYMHVTYYPYHDAKWNSKPRCGCFTGCYRT
jgi:PAS domain S-box-containing protein